MRLEARAQRSRVAIVVAPFAAIAFTLGVTMLLVAWAGAPIGQTYALMLDGGFGSRFAWSGQSKRNARRNRPASPPPRRLRKPTRRDRR